MVALQREPNNPYDKNAIKVNNVNGNQVGHLKKDRSFLLLKMKNIDCFNWGIKYVFEFFSCVHMRDVVKNCHRPLLIYSVALAVKSFWGCGYLPD